jgi:flagellar motor switch protein FliM
MASPLSKAQIKTVEKIHAEFAKEAGAYFTEIYGQVVDFEIGFVDQTTFAEYIMSLKNPTGSYTFNIHPWEGPATIDYSPGVYNCFLSKAMGKEIDGPLADDTREFMAKICVKNLAQLEKAWEPIDKINVTDATVETNPIENTIVAPSTTVLLIGFEFNGPKHSAILSVVYPLPTIESILPKLG